jgi:hypothetical protein
MRKVPRRAPGDNELRHIQQDSVTDSNSLHFGNSGCASISPFSISTEDFIVRLRVAMAIAKTLADFHDAGVAYNNLTPENVVLDTFEGDYVATFIDLSEATIFSNGTLLNQVGQVSIEDGAAFEKQMKQGDLMRLGAVLNQLFRGCEDDNTSTSVDSYSTQTLAFGGADTPRYSGEEDVRRKRNKQANRTDGLPTYLGSLISTLLLTGAETNSLNTPVSTVHYESAKDVYLDLKTMLENKNQCYCKTDLDEWMLESRLKLDTDLFYGRQVEMSILMRLLHNVFMLGNHPSIATISGK